LDLKKNYVSMSNRVESFSGSRSHQRVSFGSGFL